MLSDIGIDEVIVLAALILALYLLRDAVRRRGLPFAANAPDAPLVGRDRLRWLVLEFIELLLAGIFFIVGGAKLVGRHDMVTVFRDVGVGQWLRYLTGAIEVSGAALLVVPLFAGISAIALGAVMIAATLIELFVLHRPPVAALACLSGHSFIAWSRRAHGAKTAPSHTGTWSKSVRTRWAFGRVNKHPGLDGNDSTGRMVIVGARRSNGTRHEERSR